MVEENQLRPFQQLPFPAPADYDPGPEFFYSNFVHPLSIDAIKLMCTGLHVDYDAVEELRSTIDEVLSNVDAVLLRNPVIQDYQKIRAKKAQKIHYKKSTEAVRDPSYYLKPYENTVEHRTWVVNTYLKSLGLEKDMKDKWVVKDLKEYNIFKEDRHLRSIIDKSLKPDSKVALDGMKALAEAKAELWNRPRYDKANSKASVDPFNPGSAKQKQELFDMLGIEPFAVSEKTDDGSWGRDYIEMLQKQVEGTNPVLEEILECMIDHSYSGIIRSNFLKAFDTYTIDGVLHGNLKVFGAKSFRPTSNSPNLLNMPSTKSKYAKPLKKCFTAPEGKLVYAIDLSALEDRVISNLSGDVNKSNIFLEGLDGHSLNACGYFPDQVEEIVGKFDSTLKTVKAFMDELYKENKIVESIRQKSKAPTFKLAYGGYPDDHKGGVITQDIFDNYHNVLYPDITRYREEYVLPTTRENGYLHLGLGCRIYSDDPDGDIRTLHNATVQFWSILTLIAINEINYRVEEAGLEDSIQVCSTIYDSIYIYVDKCPETIKWLNEVAVEAICVPYLEEQVVPNEAEGEIGLNWCDLHKVPNGASSEDIAEILNKIKEESL